MENLKRIGKMLGISVDYLLDDDTVLDISAAREAKDLEAYEGSKFERKVKILTERFPDAECHTLWSKKKLSRSEKILDSAIGLFIDLSFGSVDLAKASDEINEQFFLVEDDKDQYLVQISDEFMETRKLNTHIGRKGNNYGNFED